MSEFLGDLFKAGTAAVLGGAINRFTDRGALNDKYSYLQGKGLTPQEIAGSGFGAGSSAAGNVLGNSEGQKSVQRNAQAYDEKQRNLDRAVALSGQATQLESARTSAAVGHGRNAIDAQRMAEIDLPAAIQALKTSSPEFRLRTLQMQMGPDNVIVEGILQRMGLSLSNDSLANMSDAQWSKFISQLQVAKSQAATEGAGAADALTRAGQGFLDGGRSLLSSLGNLNPLRQVELGGGSGRTLGSGPSRGR